MKSKKIPVALIMVGLALAIVEELTYKPGVGGVLFGTEGYLKGVNAMLPAWTVPGTAKLSVRYPAGYPLRLDAWLVLAGGGWELWRRNV